MEVFRKRYNKIEKAGRGTYGLVYKAFDKETGAFVALKNICMDECDCDVPTTALREIAFLKGMQHKNIIHLHQVVHDPVKHKVHLVMDFIPRDLKRVIDDPNCALPPPLIQQMTTELLEALAFCHARGVFHRDLKPSNILVDDDMHLHLCDFGLARAASVPYRSQTREVVTLWYRCPELLLGVPQYDLAVDMWSVGCILGELFLRRPMWPGDCEIDQLFQIFQTLGTPTPAVWATGVALPEFQAAFPQWPPRCLAEFVGLTPLCPAASLLRALLLYDPVHRLTAPDALRAVTAPLPEGQPWAETRA